MFTTEKPNSIPDVKLEGLPDGTVLSVAWELALAAGIQLNDVRCVRDKKRALSVLQTITETCRRNPLLAILEERGSLPEMVTIIYPGPNGEGCVLEVRL